MCQTATHSVITRCGPRETGGPDPLWQDKRILASRVLTSGWAAMTRFTPARRTSGKPTLGACRARLRFCVFLLQRDPGVWRGTWRARSRLLVAKGLHQQVCSTHPPRGCCSRHASREAHPEPMTWLRLAKRRLPHGSFQSCGARLVEHPLLECFRCWTLLFQNSSPHPIHECQSCRGNHRTRALRCCRPAHVSSRNGCVLAKRLTERVCTFRTCSHHRSGWPVEHEAPSSDQPPRRLHFGTYDGALVVQQCSVSREKEKGRRRMSSTAGPRSDP
jgi:hypothetical protein